MGKRIEPREDPTANYSKKFKFEGLKKKTFDPEVKIQDQVLTKILGHNISDRSSDDFQ